jgi:hypothetical protein
VRTLFSKHIAIFSLASYLLVLIAGEWFHDHGGCSCRSGHHASFADATGSHHTGEAVECDNACDGHDVSQSGFCLTCRFWAQKTIVAQSDTADVSERFEPISTCDGTNPSLAAVSTHLIRGPPVTA